MTLSLLGLSYIAFCLLVLAMFSHHREIFGQAPTAKQTRYFSVAGWLGLLLTYCGCVVDSGFGYGTVVFLGLLSASGLLVVLTLSYRAKFVPFAMGLSAILSATLLVIS
ncbi:DUF3325 domain-containing protein [Shewanella youngdeokensis]|uniref:DUF3325 domain-containing protein n=1 Tax=Shewanella youngdeokensis TaxID=2999068 RepID=A0ABZ0JWN6_9GAMM|nr:DUF3325 domain-containing protein [Shewanella sp. DAU334]